MAVCNICHNPVDRFFPYKGGWAGYSDFIRSVDMVGSDVDNYGCPHCQCSDRERHLFLYFERLDIWGLFFGTRILHVAPEPKVMEGILAREPAEYVPGDYQPHAPWMRKIDLTALEFPDSFFDIIICNHVLEHVSDDRRAMAELLRVMKPGGFAILQTPYSRLLHNTFEDEGIETDELRLKLYGQSDHVRLFGRDLFNRLEAAGFVLDVIPHDAVMSDKEVTIHGVNPKEELIRVRKDGRRTGFAGVRS